MPIIFAIFVTFNNNYTIIISISLSPWVCRLQANDPGIPAAWAGAS